MKVVFMGTPDFSVPALEALVAAGHQVAGVVTQPDKPKGRGKEMQITAVKKAAVSHGIPVYQPARVKGNPEFMAQLKKIDPGVIVVIAFGQILPKEILELPKYGCINIHASLLPKYRGAAPIQWVIIDGEKETGITTMYMEEGLDTGDMLLKTIIPIDEEETGGSLHDKLSAAGGPLIVETLKKLEAGSLVRIPQEGESCYAKILTKSLGDIDWNMDAASIERLIRGLLPWPSAYTRLKDRTVKIWKAGVIPEQGEKAVPGTVIAIGKESFSVQTGKGLLEVKELQPEGKKRMDAGAFLRGYPLKTGDVFERKQ
ncbi:methionyl-tRNA formyltransferase [Lacrimispora sp. NSJ-141]|uniref:Methionyl-tRNA formyltransferase n=1 Tax=Lientehia hominis TaxID=2897778 RepID=A0AAP2RJ37_9FIRM|nr:methionyl-tRNA formyltransferase [Lientehia hominis]MCD2492364.1 methionyl-tRNA formyltransferase [Lientehia hominis]